MIDHFQLGSREVGIRRPFPARAHAIATESAADHARWTAAAVRLRDYAAEPDAKPGRVDQFIRVCHLEQAAVAGALVAAFLVDPEPPRKRDDEGSATYARRVWAWLEETGWSPQDAEGLLVLCRAALQKARELTIPSEAVRLWQDWKASPTDELLARVAVRLLGDPLAPTRSRGPDGARTPWELLPQDRVAAEIALVLGEDRRHGR